MGSLSTPSLDYSHFLSAEAKRRYPAPLKALRKYAAVEGMIMFAGGLPNPSTFPSNGLTVSVTSLQKTVAVPGFGNPDALIEYPKSGIVAPINLSTALQYGHAAGNPELLKFLKEFQMRQHNPPSPIEIINTVGNTDGTDCILRTLSDVGDGILVSTYDYPGILGGIAAVGCGPIPVKLDAEGMLPESLDEIMTNYDEKARGYKKPRIVILVPTCQNPTGSTMSLQRRKDFYQVCCKHNILIVEDDPYFYLQLCPAGQSWIPSLLSMDTEGRVVRLDSFSKIMSPGTRCGWLSGPKAIVDKIILRNEVSSNAPSGVSSAFLLSILTAYGQDGFDKYLYDISAVYAKRCLYTIAAFDKYLPSIVKYGEGKGGMFLFFSIDCSSHPQLSTLGLDGIEDQIFQECIKQLVLIAPGKYFLASSKDEPQDGKIWFRMSFANPGESELEEGAKRLGKALKICFGLE